MGMQEQEAMVSLTLYDDETKEPMFTVGITVHDEVYDAEALLKSIAEHFNCLYVVEGSCEQH